MNTQFQEFFGKYDGQSVEIEDSSAKYQCMDLVFAWVDFLGIPRESIRHSLAYQVYSNPVETTNQFFNIYPNTPEGVPQAGDIVIFGTQVGPAGHCCIASGNGDINSFESFDQNWNTQSDFHVDSNGNHIPYSHLVIHNYSGVLGWLRPIKSEDRLVTSLQTQLGTQIQATSSCQEQLKIATDRSTQLANEVVTLQKTIDDLNSKNATDSQEIISLNGALQNLAKTNKDYAQEAYDASHSLGIYIDYLHVTATRLGINQSNLKDGDIFQEILNAIDNLEKQAKAQAQAISDLSTATQKAGLIIGNNSLWKKIKGFFFTA